MKNCWIFIKSFYFYLKLKKQMKLNDEPKVELYVCSLCGTMYLDKTSYITHYKLDMCSIPMDIFPNEPITIKDKQ